MTQSFHWVPVYYLCLQWWPQDKVAVWREKGLVSLFGDIRTIGLYFRCTRSIRHGSLLRTMLKFSLFFSPST